MSGDAKSCTHVIRPASDAAYPKGFGRKPWERGMLVVVPGQELA